MSLSGSKRLSRSVIDYQTEEQLRRALLTSGIVACSGGNSSDESERSERSIKRHFRANHQVGVTNTVMNIDESNDWVFTSYDPETTEAQSMKEELQRLQVLKSYLMLDGEREEIFERITRTAAKHFDAPIVLISLVDLGRQWFMSNRGLPFELRETPRKHAFCSHAIKQKVNKQHHNDMNLDEQPLYPLLIVPDATLDYRFRNNPLVTGPPDIRFYAGASLVSPEGYKLGTLCVIDQKTRPEGLDEDQQETLRDLAAIVMQAMVDRRYRLESRACDPEKLIAYTAHDLMTPLTGIQLSLTMMKEDDVIMQRLCSHGIELLNTATSCADVMLRICQTSVDGLREQVSKAGTSAMANKISEGSITRLEDLLSSLRMIMDPIQKKVPMIITVDQSVPPSIVADDLKLFRSALNLLSNAANRTTSGSIHLKIFPDMDEMQHYRKRQNGSEEPILVFECEDTGEDIHVEDYQILFQPNTSSESWDVENSQVGLSSVASLVSRMHGAYGFRPRGIRLTGEIVLDSKGRPYRGAIFWFWIPLIVPESLFGGHDSHEIPFIKPILSTASSITEECEDTNDDGFSAASIDESQALRQKNMTETFDVSVRRCLSYGNLKSKTMVQVENAEQAGAIRDSCLNAVFAPSIKPQEGDQLSYNRARSNSPKPASAPNLFTSLLGRKGESTSSLSVNKRQEKLVSFQNSTWSTNSVGSTSGVNKALASFSLDSKSPNGSAVMNVPPRSNGLNGIKHNGYQTQNTSVNFGIHSKTESVDTKSISESSSNERKRNGHNGIKHGGSQAQNTTGSLGNQSKDEPVDAAHSESSKERKRRALIIDDCGIIRKTLSRALSKHGYDTVVLAVDGMEGLQELKKELFDIVLCDFLMPVMDGLDCIKQYREWEQENRPHFNQPIIGMSAHANANDRGQGIDVGMDDFKAKPVNIKTLLEIKSSELCLTRSQQLDKIEGYEPDNIEPAINEQGNEPATGPGRSPAPKTLGLRTITIPANDTSSHLSTSNRMQMDDDKCSSLDSKRPKQIPVCLMASDTPTLQSNISIALLEAMGWGVVVINDGAAALRLLQMRNWDVVLIDDDISDVNGQSCVAAFREWEDMNRINVQKNVFLVCDGDIPSPRDVSSVVQPPSGCNGVLRKPVPWEDLSFVLERNGIGNTMEIVIRH